MSKRLITFLTYSLTVTILSVIVGCSGGGGTVADTDIAVSWGDTSMTVADFKYKMYVRYTHESRAKKKPLEDRRKILDEYVMRALKIGEGYRLNFNERDDILKQYNDAIERRASDLLYDSKVTNKFITDEMIKDFANFDRYEARCRHILIEMNEDVKGRDTLEFWKRVNEVYEEAKEGKNFKRLVDKYSDDSSIERKLHGDLGFFKWGKMVDEFQEATWKLDEGEISPPVRTRYGYHIIKLLEKRSTSLEMNTSDILVKVNRRAAPGESLAAWERATTILEEAKKKGADFSQLARRYSEDDKTWVNGIVGWIPRGSMPSDYWDKALTMKVGETDGPARSYKGYHIIKINDIRDNGLDIDDEDVLKKIKSAIGRVYRDTLNTISEAYLNSIREDYGLKYNQSVIKMMMRKLADKNAPKNMNLFSSFTPEERELLVVEDKLGGFTIQGLVDMYGDHRFPPPFEDKPDYIKEMVEPLLLPKYLADIAKQEGFTKLPEVLVEGKKAIENAMLPEVEREMVYNRATPSEEEVRKYYEKNPKEFVEPQKAKIYEILVDDKQLAEDMLTRVKKGEDFGKLAKRYSQRSMAKHKGGKLGPFKKDKYGAVSRKAFDLEVDEIAGPIAMGGKYSVIKLIEMKPEVTKDFDEVKRQIESNLRFERQKDLKDAWEKELVKSYNVQVNESILKDVWPLIDPLPEALVAERKIWKKERSEAGKLAKRRAKEDQIKLKLKPGSKQQYTTKDGKKIDVTIGQPRYLDKDGKEIDPSKSNIKLTPKGKIEKKGTGSKKKGNAPRIKIKPKGE
ncbi:MAG: peptidylprolyl isomerase [Candidatus Hatepunaea meridiana]|nr:peptidylprolyl isomerase [Candidatus Hatepunaea meridiana]